MKKIFNSLSLNNNVTLLTGTSNLTHLEECFKIVERFNANKTFKLTCFIKEDENNPIVEKSERLK